MVRREAEEGLREVFAAVFGSSSEEESDEEDEEVFEGNVEVEVRRRVWEAVEGVDGLWRCERFLDATEQESLVAAIESGGWLSEPSRNQAMWFGDLPGWALTLSSLIFSSITPTVGERDGESPLAAPLPEDILHRRPLFDQMIMNSYQPGEGILPHVDLARFEDGIAVLSLLSTCVMRFRECAGPSQVDLLLSPGDLILLSGEARYKWTHEINRAPAEAQVWAGKVLEQKKRISVTLRRLCPE